MDSWTTNQPLIHLGSRLTPLCVGIPLLFSVAKAYNLKPWPDPNYRCRALDVRNIWNHLNMLQNFSLQTNEDSWSWSLNREISQPFSTAYTWKSIDSPQLNVKWYKTVWFKRHIPKHAFLLWLAMQDKMPVKVRLYQWRIVQDPFCIFCGCNFEDRDHVLLKCKEIEGIWRMVMQRFCGNPCSFINWSSFETWLLSHSPNCGKTLKRLAAQATIYHIWRERNTRLHTAVALQPWVIFKQIDRTIRDVLLARRKRKHFSSLLQMWFRGE